MELSKDDILKNMFFSANRSQTETEQEELKITMLPIDVIDGLTSVEHAFEKSIYLDIEELAASINLVGVQEPIIVRPKEGGRYESVAGHRRTLAAKLAGKTTIPAIIRKIDDDETIIISTDTNLKQRGHIYPSEKAKAYQMQLDVLKAQGKRNDLIRKVEGLEESEAAEERGKKSRDVIAERYHVSPRTISNYIRLLLLIEPLLEFVDEEKLTVMIGVSVSYLKESHQALLFQLIKDCPEMLTGKKAEMLKALEQQKQLTETAIRDVLQGKKKERTAQKPVYQTALKKVEQYCRKLDPEDLERLSRCEEEAIIETIKDALQTLLKRSEDFSV